MYPKLFKLLKKLIKERGFKIGKMVLPDGKTIPLIFNPKPQSVAEDIKDVYPLATDTVADKDYYKNHARCPKCGSDKIE